jgi:CRP/FNR family cyclic AMP-dependent transcriptional regulator
VLEETRLAVLDREFGAKLVHYPEVNVMVLERLIERSHRLATMQAISQLNGVDRRLMTLFWHLAERWGHVTGEGVVVSLAVPHRVVSQLVGARRPTVSTAISRLAARGELTRRSDGAWLLTGTPYGLPTNDVERIVRRRRFGRAPGSEFRPRSGI